MKTQDLTITADISKDRFEIICADALRLTTFTKFLIGDIVNVAKGNGWTSSDKYQKFISSTGYSIRTIQEFALVSARIPKEIRQKDISFSHHTAIASLNHEEQEQRLSDVKERGLSVMDLKGELKVKEKDLGEAFKDYLLNDRFVFSVKQSQDLCDTFLSEMEFFKGYKISQEEQLTDLDIKFCRHKYFYDRLLFTSDEPWDFVPDFDDTTEIDKYVARQCKIYFKRIAMKIVENRFE